MKLFDNFLPLTLLIFLFHDNQKDPSTGLPAPKNEACAILSDTKTRVIIESSAESVNHFISI